MKKRTIKHITAILLVLIPSVYLRYSYMLVRPPLTHDEAISYLAAAGKQDDYQEKIAQGLNGSFKPVEFFKEFMLPDDAFTISEVNESMSEGDFHPPLYYWLLRTWLYFTGLNLKINLILNMIISVLTCFLLYFYSYTLTRSIYAGFLGALVFGVSPAAIHLTGYLRHYELLTFITTAFVIIIDLISREKKKSNFWWFLMSFCAATGLITHVFFLLILIPAYLLAFIRLYFSEKNLLFKLSISLLLSIMLALIMFPQYPIQFNNKLSNALVAQQALENTRSEKLINLTVLFAGNYFTLVNAYFDVHPVRAKIFYMFLLVLIAVAVYISIRYKTSSSWLSAGVFLIGLAGYVTAYLLEMIPYWSMNFRYLGFLFPLLPLSLISIFSKRGALKLISLFLTIYAIVLFSGTYNNILYQKQYEPEYNFLNSKNVVVGGINRGYFFCLIYYLPEKINIYPGRIEDLKNQVTSWSKELRKGDSIVFITTSKESKEHERFILKEFYRLGGKKLRSFRFYYSNFHCYVVE